MKKPFQAVLLASLVLGACEKSDNVTQLHEESVAIAKYYGPRVDELGKRRDAIFQRGRNVPGNLPDVPEIVRLIGEAGDKINEMKGITGAIEKQADEAAKANKADELARLNDESREKLDTDTRIANDDLARVESWLWQYESGRSALPPPPPPVPAPSDATEPPPAAEGSAAAAPKADDRAEKAAQKAAGEKTDKTGGEKAAPKADKAAAAKADKAGGEKAAPKADKAAAPKADKAAGSATK